MLLTLTTTYQPATDLGFLLHKHPDRLQTTELPFGHAHVFYPQSSAQETTAALLLDIDPVALVRRGSGAPGAGFALAEYVNDRPYVASSFLSVALAKVFSTALNATCHKRPDLVARPFPLRTRVSVVSAPAGGEGLIRAWFEPLGYTVEVTPCELDPAFPDWGKSHYYTLELYGELPLHSLLAHLYVLLPALDREKHYYISEGEAEKLLRKGGDWLAAHPEREAITRRYLGGFASLTRLVHADWMDGEISHTSAETAGERTRQSLHDLRLEAVAAELKAAGAERVIDLGCGEGKLLRLLLKERQFTRIEGTDVAYGELAKAMDRLRYDDLPDRQKERLRLWQGSLTYRDARMEGFDAAALVEVIEHLDAHRLRSLERVVFGHARPGTVIVTTPNAEYNARYENLTAGTMRHADHRFEWTRAEFREWASRIAADYAYTFTLKPLGPLDDAVGSPSQMAIFTYAA